MMMVNIWLMFTKSFFFFMFGFKTGSYTTWFIGHGGNLGFYFVFFFKYSNMMDPIHRTDREHMEIFRKNKNGW